MIPQTITPKVLEATVQPSLTYKIDVVNNRLIGKIDNQESVMQAIQKILDTDRYAYEIYDWNYGQQLLKLIGKDVAYCEAEIPRIVSEALLQDDRIKEVTDYKFEQTDINSLTVSFLVKTIFGDYEYDKEIKI